MANLIVALLTLAAILTSVVVLSQSAFAPQGEASEALKSMRAKTDEMAGTEITAVSVSVTGGGSNVELTVRNDGRAPLRVAGDWDLVFAYDPSATSTGLRIVHLDYTDQDTLSDDQWSLEGIYADATKAEAELFGSGIVDTGEEAIINAKLATPIAGSSTNSLALTTSRGVTVSTQFSN